MRRRWKPMNSALPKKLVYHHRALCSRRRSDSYPGRLCLCPPEIPGKEADVYAVRRLQLLPGTVTMIPPYLMWTNILHLNGTFLPLILPYFCGGGAFNIFLIRQFISAIPRELDEGAATIDGANRMQILFQDPASGHPSRAHCSGAVHFHCHLE